MTEAKITERGWPAHFVGADDCIFRRNTLIEVGEQRVVVSTVGCYFIQWPGEKGRRIEMIGHDRYFETMAWRAKYEDPYWEADISAELDFDGEWSVNHIERHCSQDANNNHDAAVQWFVKKMEHNAKEDLRIERLMEEEDELRAIRGMEDT